MISPRTLRCANAAMYAVITLIVIAATVYVWCTEARMARCIAATAAALTSTVWALYYVLLRFRVDAQGIVEYNLFRRPRRIDWAELTSARLEEVQLQGIAGLTIILESPSTTITISSRVLSMDAVEELADELRSAAILRDLSSPSPQQ